MTDQHIRLFKIADYLSNGSPNRKAKVGAVLYDLATGEPLAGSCNTLTTGMPLDREDFHQAPLKAMVWEHAERNTIYAAARNGICTRGTGMAVNWYPCADCARAVVAAGITELVVEEPDLESDERWKENWLAAAIILENAGINVIMLPPTRWTKPTPEKSKASGIVIHFPGADSVRLEPVETTLEPIA